MVRRVACEVPTSRVYRILLGVGFALLLGYVSTGRVLAQEPYVPTAAGVWNRCWIEQGGLPADHVQAAQDLLRPVFLVRGHELRVPYSLARATLSETGPARASLEILNRYEIPLWRTKPVDWAESRQRPLALIHGVNACLPYPVKSVSAVPTSVIRGHSLAVAIELDRSAACRYTFLDETGPCYWEGERDAYVIVGLSALMEPGRYPLRIEIVSDGGEALVALPLEITPGTYGFQYIDPPPALSQLMNAELMASESAFLAQWRGLRSADRYWDLPLLFPLPETVPVTAGYGDRRSYGGMVEGYHSGVDYGAWGGMNVLAPASGTVVMVEPLEMRGNSVLIDHGWGLVTGYWHLSSVDVQVGDGVVRGQPFAQVGNTGLSTGPHLHWEVWSNGVSVDGRQWLAADFLTGIVLPPSVPLHAATGDE
jgi:hypothetical protein